MTAEAQARLNAIPFLIRLFVQRRLQAAAKKRGLSLIDVQLIEELKSKEHRGA